MPQDGTCQLRRLPRVTVIVAPVPSELSMNSDEGTTPRQAQATDTNKRRPNGSLAS